MLPATFETRVGPDGRIHLRIPDEVAHANQEVVVTVQPTAAAEEEREARLKRISAFHGAIDDPEFKRHPQGELREIAPLS